MGFQRLALYLVGLVVVVLAAWVFLTQSEVANVIPGGLALALILLIVGIGVMAAARSVDDRRTTRRVVHDGGTIDRPVERRVDRDVVHEDTGPRSETFVDERRYD